MPAPISSNDLAPTGTDPDQQPPRQGMSLGALIVLAVFVGLVVGALSIFPHLSVWYIGEVGIPWGALLSLLLVGASCLSVGLAASKPLGAALTGMVAYCVTVLASFWPGSDTLAVPINGITFSVMPYQVIAEILWLLGIPVVTIIAMLMCQRVLRPRVKKPANQPANSAPSDD